MFGDSRNLDEMVANVLLPCRVFRSRLAKAD